MTDHVHQWTAEWAGGSAYIFSCECGADMTPEDIASDLNEVARTHAIIDNFISKADWDLPGRVRALVETLYCKTTPDEFTAMMRHINWLGE
jgi:hypothetical protein